MGKQGPFSTIALWALAVLTLCYTLPSFVGTANLPGWFTGMFNQQLSYGLDLQGGLELRYTVDWKKAISDNSRKVGDTVQQRLVEELEGQGADETKGSLQTGRGGGAGGKMPGADELQLGRPPAFEN